MGPSPQSTYINVSLTNERFFTTRADFLIRETSELEKELVFCNAKSVKVGGRLGFGTRSSVVALHDQIAHSRHRTQPRDGTRICYIVTGRDPVLPKFDRTGQGPPEKRREDPVRIMSSLVSSLTGKCSPTSSSTKQDGFFTGLSRQDGTGRKKTAQGISCYTVPITNGVLIFYPP